MTNTEKMSGTKAQLVEEIQTRGAWAAYTASLAVCEDGKAPASARAQAASNILRAGGYFAPRPDDSAPKEPSEMSYDELQSSIAALKDRKTDTGIFD